MQKNLTFKQLRALDAVLRTGSITKAAEELCVTPPAISTQIKTLENLIQNKVVKRTHDGFCATDCGQEVQILGLQIQAAIENSAQKLDALKTGKAGSFGIGVVSTGKYFAPHIISAFMKAYADIDLRLLIGNRGKIIHALKNHSIDLAIMGRAPDGFAVAHDYLGEHPFGIIAAPRHPLANLQTVPAAKLLAEMFLMRETGSGTRALAMRYLDQYGSGKSYRVLEMNANETIKQAVMADMGIAMLSLHTVRHEIAENRLVALKAPGLPLLRKWILVYPASNPLSGAAACFRDFLLQRRQQFIPDVDI